METEQKIKAELKSLEIVANAMDVAAIDVSVEAIRALVKELVQQRDDNADLLERSIAREEDAADRVRALEAEKLRTKVEAGV